MGSPGVLVGGAKRRPGTPRERADAVAQPHAVVSATAGGRAVVGREDDERALRWAQDVGAALGSRTLLEQHELAALEVDAGLAEHGDDLEREVDVAVEVLVQGVPVAGAVAQDQRRRTLLARPAAGLEQRLVVERERIVGPAQTRRPRVGDRRELPVEGAPQRADRLRQRMVEVAVAAVAEAIAGHVDRRAEAAAVEQLGELGALAGTQDRLGDREALSVELLPQGAPLESVDAVGHSRSHDRATRGNRRT